MSRSRSSSSRKRSSRKRRKVAPKTRTQRFLLRFGWILPIGAILIGSGILALTYAFASIPLPKDVEYLDSSAEVYDRNGQLIGTYQDEVKRFLINTKDLPRYIGRAVVASEDRDFYDHGGLSLRGIARAAWANVSGGEIAQGGSTITQQYVKQAILRDPSRTVTRKVKEAILAIKIERRYSKKEILAFYLNTIYLGRGAYGFEAAARTYFDKHAEDLTLAEAAYLAGIIPAPERYQPDDNQIGARERRDRVLRMMAQEGFISEPRARRAMKGRVKLEGKRQTTTRQKAAFFMEWLRKDFLYPEYGERLYTGGLKIYTSLDLSMQEAAEEAIATTLTEPGDPQAALVSMTPRGEVRAFVGGRDFRNVKKARGFNFAADYPGRQSGSAFKPFTLMTAVKEGISTRSYFSGASPATIEEEECAGPDGLWQPENYGGASYGTMSLDQATTNSVNVVYAQLAAEVGPGDVAETVADFGFDRRGTPAEREIPEVCSLSLGTLDVTPVEMARAYATFAGRGRRPEVTPIRYVTDSSGGCIQYLPDPDAKCGKEPEVEYERVVEPNDADVVNETLTHVVEGGTATSANIGRPVAGKTGTTQNNQNAWFAGYVPQMATVVWMGYPAEVVDRPATETTGDAVGKNKSLIVPEMRYCFDPVLCRPVHGYEVTGGGSPVSPSVMWAKFMSQATAELEPLPFPAPTDLPDEIINSPAPVYVPPPEPAPSDTGKPEPEPSEPEPTQPPPPQPTEPSPQPTVLPTESPGGDGRGGDGGGGRDRGGGGGRPGRWAQRR